VTAPLRTSKPFSRLASAALVFVLLAGGCASPAGDWPRPTPQEVQSSVPPTDPWAATLLKTPYPYLLPLPEPTRTLIDGTYTKVELKEEPPVHCLRCPDYAPEGGVWKLHFDRGTYWVFHKATGWNSMGSFVLSKDRRTAGTRDQLVLFNDPACPGYVGTYAWRLEGEQLILEAIEDTCSIHLRAMNLTNLPWLSCQPPNREAGISDHWLKPPGCD
jgi:hypothetical protein